MEEFIDLYRYLARCYVELEKLEREKIDEFLQRISGLVASEKTGPVLIKLLLDLIKRSDEVDKLDDGLNTILPAIIEIEDKLHSDTIPDNSDNSDVSDKKPQGNIHLFDKKTVLRSFGACKVYPKIFKYVFTNLGTEFSNEDTALLIKKYYTDVLERHIADSSTRTYANCYMKYMLEEGLVTAEFGAYTKKNADSKETKELKKLGDSITGKSSPDEPKETEQHLEKEEPNEEPKNTEEKPNNEFENFQDRILEAAESNGWDQVPIEKIEEIFKVTKNEKQVQKALGKLLVKEKVLQMPPTLKDILDAKKHDKPKPKGYIRFLKN